MNKRLFIIIIFLLTISLTACGGKSTPTAKRSILAEAVNGKVTATLEGTSSDVVKGEKLESGEEIEVKDSSDLTLLLDSDKHVFAESETMFDLEAVTGGTGIVLMTGTLRVSIDNKLNDGEYFEVTTQNAVMSVRGTVFTVKVYITDGKYRTELSVESGEVEVTTVESGEEKKNSVMPGETVTLSGVRPGLAADVEEKSEAKWLKVRETEYNADGSVHSTCDYEYGDNGHLTGSVFEYVGSSKFVREYDDNEILRKETVYSSDGSLSQIAEFNEYGDHVSAVVYSDGALYYTVKDEYDSQRRWLSREYVYADGTTDKFFESEFTGNQEKKLQYNLGEVINTEHNTYDDNGNMIERKTYDVNGDLSSTESFVYDADGNRIEARTVDEFWGDSLTKYQYDKEGNVIKEETFADDGTLLGSFTDSYEYNEQGLPVHRTVDSEGEFDASHSEYYYEYDDNGNLIKKTYYSEGKLSIYTIYEYIQK